MGAEIDELCNYAKTELPPNLIRCPELRNRCGKIALYKSGFTLKKTYFSLATSKLLVNGCSLIFRQTERITELFIDFHDRPEHRWQRGRKALLMPPVPHQNMVVIAYPITGLQQTAPQLQILAPAKGFIEQANGNKCIPAAKNRHHHITTSGDQGFERHLTSRRIQFHVPFPDQFAPEKHGISVNNMDVRVLLEVFDLMLKTVRLPDIVRVQHCDEFSRGRPDGRISCG